MNAITIGLALYAIGTSAFIYWRVSRIQFWRGRFYAVRNELDTMTHYRDDLAYKLAAMTAERNCWSDWHKNLSEKFVYTSAKLAAHEAREAKAQKQRLANLRQYQKPAIEPEYVTEARAKMRAGL